MPESGPQFRKVVLAKISSPEQLDELMRVTSPRGWLSLLALGLLVSTAVLWGILGRIPTKVQGQGILLKSGGVFELVAVGSGQVSTLSVKVGDAVERGQVIARIAQPELVEQIRTQRLKWEEEKKRSQQIEQFGTEDMRLKGRYSAEQRETLQRALDRAAERVQWLEEKIANQAGLLDEGLITKETLNGTKHQYDAVKAEMESARNQLRKLEVEEAELRNQKEAALAANRLELNEIERSIQLLENKLENTSQVPSPHAGRVLEIRAEEGQHVAPGTPILNLELADEKMRDLEALIYVPATEGKKVEPGMSLQISPSSVQKEEFGLMLGRVVRVAEFPSTSLGMMKSLQNERLVQTFQEATGGAPIEIRAELEADPETPSGYKWSSSQGPPVRIQTGTVCTASVTIRTQRPIALVIPVFKKLFGV